MTFEEGRAQFPVLEQLAYLQAGSVGPLARATIEAMHVEEERNLRDGRAGMPYFERVLALRDELRREIGALVGAGPELVALTTSTTDGCNIVLAGLDLGPDDEVVTTTDEHFGLIGPLHASGAKVVVVPPEPDQIVSAVTPRTRLLALSHVLWTTGQVLVVHDLKAHTGLPILVDGAQSVGAIPVDARGLDFYTISGQKWLCGPEATGALVVAEPERLRVGRPSYFAQQEHQPNGAFVPKPGASRFDPGWISAAQLSGLRAARQRSAISAARVNRHSGWASSAALQDAGMEVVVPIDRATLVSWRVPAEESAAFVARLSAAGVIVRDLLGRGLVRASVGWWTSDDDLERLVAAL